MLTSGTSVKTSLFSYFRSFLLSVRYPQLVWGYGIICEQGAKDRSLDLYLFGVGRARVHHRNRRVFPLQKTTVSEVVGSVSHKTSTETFDQNVVQCGDIG